MDHEAGMEMVGREGWRVALCSKKEEPQKMINRVCYGSNSHIEILIPSVMKFGDGGFGRSLGHEDGPIMVGLMSL